MFFCLLKYRPIASSGCNFWRFSKSCAKRRCSLDRHTAQEEIALPHIVWFVWYYWTHQQVGKFCGPVRGPKDAVVEILFLVLTWLVLLLLVPGLDYCCMILKMFGTSRVQMANCSKIVAKQIHCYGFLGFRSHCWIFVQLGVLYGMDGLPFFVLLVGLCITWAAASPTPHLNPTFPGTCVTPKSDDCCSWFCYGC